MLFVAGVVVVAILLGKNPMTLFAGLGATSAVLMLVFKDTILGLAAGVRLTSNDMLHKGDWITVKSVDANGIVEDMSLTTVKVRNFDNTIVTISPSYPGEWFVPELDWYAEEWGKKSKARGLLRFP